MGQRTNGLLLVALMAVMVVLSGLSFFWVGGSGAGGAPPRPTPTAIAADSPLDVLFDPYKQRLDRAIVAYVCGSSSVIGAIEPQRKYTELGRTDEWVRLDVEGSGIVCTTAKELPAND